MAGRTGYTKVQNTDPMQGPAQITSVYEHFDPLVGETKPNRAALPVSGNWPGRTIYVEDKRSQSVWDAPTSEWVHVADDTGWIPCVYRSGYETQSTATLRVRLRAGVLAVDGLVKRTGGATFPNTLVTVADMPPSVLALLSSTVYYAGVASAATVVRVNIDGDGRMGVTASNTAATWVGMSGMFFLGA